MQLHIGGLSDDTGEADLEKLFSKIGTVESVSIVKDITSGKSRGFGLVRMPSSTEAEEAITRLNGTTLKKRPIVVTRMRETLPGEMELREWLRENASQVLPAVGIRQGQTVLDYGCGPGFFTIPCARIVGKPGKVYAFDVRPEALERVKEKADKEELDNIATILADSSKLATGFPDGSMDVILVYDVIHAIDDKLGLLEELRRILKEGGWLSIFPMHLGTDKIREIMKQCPWFRFRDHYAPPGHKTASVVLNFTKYQPRF